MSEAQKHLTLLGHKARDRVTGLEGVVDSVCFDLYGCIQCSLNQGFDKEGKRKEAYWFDVSRIEIIHNVPVMDQPNYVKGPVAEGQHGCAEKPSSKA